MSDRNHPDDSQEQKNEDRQSGKDAPRNWSALGPVHKALFEADDDEDIESDTGLDPASLNYEDSDEDDHTYEDDEGLDLFGMYPDEEED